MIFTVACVCSSGKGYNMQLQRDIPAQMAAAIVRIYANAVKSLPGVCRNLAKFH